MMIAAYILSFVGFADLINYLYNIMGVVGLFIVVAVLIKYYKRKSDDKTYCIMICNLMYFTIKSD